MPAVTNGVERSRYDTVLPASYGPPVGGVMAPDPSDRVAYGAYLAGPVAHCIECHSPSAPDGGRDTGKVGWGGSHLFKGPWGVSVAPDLTSTGLSDWSDTEIARAITTGIEKGGGRLRPPMGFAYYAGMATDDLAAIVAYLRSLPPSRI